MADESIKDFQHADKHELLSVFHVLQIGVNQLELERLHNPLTGEAKDINYQKQVRKMQARAKAHMKRIENRIAELLISENTKEQAA